MTGVLLGLLPLDVPVAIDPDEARRRAVEELSRFKYAGVPQWVIEQALRILARLLQLAEQLARIGRPGGGGFPWPLVLVLVAVAALIALVVWKVGLPRLNARRADSAVGADPARAPQTYRTAAEAAADAGDWRLAIRERFRGTVRSLEELTVLDVRPARTAWEVARVAGRQVPVAQNALDGAATIFNDVLYGDVPGTAAAYQQLTAWDAEIVAAASSADLTDPVDVPTPTGRRG